MVFEIDDDLTRNAAMRVIGVGGGGGNAIDRMLEEEFEGVEFIVVNTDAQALQESKCPTRIQIGRQLTRGLGAGAQPEIGRQAIAENEAEIQSAIEGADMVFIAAGMGGGTGTGASPAIARVAREMGALCVAIVTRPFSFEGTKRTRHAEMGIRELKRSADTIIVVPNDRLLSVVGGNTSFHAALKEADNVLLHAAKGITDLIAVTGSVNVDFADVRTVMSLGGSAIMGMGESQGDDRSVRAAQQAISSPLLDNCSVYGAKGVLVNISGGDDMTLDDVTTINSTVREAIGEEADMIFGTVYDPKLAGEIRVTVIATGFQESNSEEEDEEFVEPDRIEPESLTERVSETSYVGPRMAGGPGGGKRAAPPDRTYNNGGWNGNIDEYGDLETPTFIRRQIN